MSDYFLGFTAITIPHRRQSACHPLRLGRGEQPPPAPQLLVYAASHTWLRILAAISALSCGRNRPWCWATISAVSWIA